MAFLLDLQNISFCEKLYIIIWHSIYRFKNKWKLKKWTFSDFILGEICAGRQKKNLMAVNFFFKCMHIV